jgi:hypothetical protein
MLTKKLLFPAFGIIIIISSFAGACATTRQLAAPPYIPGNYYNCIETYPQELVHAYFAGYGEIWGPKAMYNNKVFVFKDNLIDEYMIRELDKGWIWLDLIKCPLVNLDDMKQYKLGDRIDVVGLNLGPEDDDIPGLTFTDCYVLPCGSLKLPAEGDGGAVGPSY